MSQAIHNDIAVQSESDLPPPRDRKKALRSVSPPLSNVPFSRFTYALVILAAAILAFYAWRLMQWKTEMGGWWNLALGRKPPVIQGSGQNPSVDQSIEELALALGIPSKDLAIAISGAVKEHVPPASLSSIAAHETGDTVKYMVDPSGASASDSENSPASAASMGFKTVASAFDAVVGFDEPPTEVEEGV